MALGHAACPGDTLLCAPQALGLQSQARPVPKPCLELIHMTEARSSYKSWDIC